MLAIVYVEDVSHLGASILRVAAFCDIERTIRSTSLSGSGGAHFVALHA
jgi:hypothetical protein